MELSMAIKTRHSVRSYKDKKIQAEVLQQLNQTIEECNLDSGLNIQLCIDEPTAFSSMMARYGKFENVKNYIALVGKKSKYTEEKCGYYGEKIVLRAQQLGLNSCWVGMSFSKGNSKKHIKISPDEKLYIVIALGYGVTNGVSHRSKPLEEVAKIDKAMPDWFLRGVEAARMAPTSMNQQKFLFALNGSRVTAIYKMGPYSKINLGIVKYHFEIGAESADWRWAD